MKLNPEERLDAIVKYWPLKMLFLPWMLLMILGVVIGMLYLRLYAWAYLEFWEQD